MKCKKLSLGIISLFIIGFGSCEKKRVEPAEPTPQLVTVDTIPQDSVIVTNTGTGSGSGGTSTTVVLGDMSVMNGLYFGTYNGGYIPNVSRIDSIYAEVDSVGTTCYEFKIYSDRSLNNKIREFRVRFQTLAFLPCDIGIPTIYSTSSPSTRNCYFDESRYLEILDCNSIKASRGTYGSGRGGCSSYNTQSFVGERIY